MPRKNKTTKKGFTLIETLIAISILVLIVGVLSTLAVNIFKYNSFISTSLNTAEANREALKKMTAEIRSASTSSNGSYPIETATAYTFSFFGDINNDGLKERVRYFISGTTLKKGILKPTGSPSTYNTANETTSIFVKNIINTNSIFAYYDKNYDGTSAPLSSPVNVNLIRLIKITLTTDENVNREPGPDTITTQISIRNLKDNL